MKINNRTNGQSGDSLFSKISCSLRVRASEILPSLSAYASTASTTQKKTHKRYGSICHHKMGCIFSSIRIIFFYHIPYRSTSTCFHLTCEASYDLARPSIDYQRLVVWGPMAWRLIIHYTLVRSLQPSFRRVAVTLRGH